MVKEIKSINEFNMLLNDNTYVFVDFYADWCRPCKEIAPHIDELAHSHPIVKCVKVNVENCPDISEEQEIQALPTFKLYHNGKLLKTIVGSKLNDIVKLLGSI